MKTVREHLNDLKEPERTEALEALASSAWGNGNQVHSNLHDALYVAFAWNVGEKWYDIHERLQEGTYFDAPQLTPETCEAQAKEAMHERPATQEEIEDLESICLEAYRIQGGDRQQDYGSPKKNFDEIAAAWNCYLKTSCGVDVNMEARDVAHMNILMKICRNVHKPKRDNWVDMAGYAQCGGKVDGL